MREPVESSQLELESQPTGPQGPLLSQLAVVATIWACAVPLIGGVLGVVFGLMALRRIRAAEGGLYGAGMAWFAILVGALQLAGGGAVLVRSELDTDRSHAVVGGFSAALCGNDRALLWEYTARGLRPEVDRLGDEVCSELVKALGPFEALGEERSSRTWWNGEVRADYELEFAKGAPARAQFVLSREGDDLRVLELSIHSPVLQRPLELRGSRSKELGRFTGPKAGKLKSYRP